MKHSALQHLRPALVNLESAGLLRRRPEPLPTGALSFCSNDYLGLADRPAPMAASGSGASRLVAGERPEHLLLERLVAEWLGAESALTFSSGFVANVAVLTALASSGDLIVSDALNHASIIDGARLSRARVSVVPHLDVGAVDDALAAPRAGRAWVVTESYFSMDADTPDLAALREICDRRGAALIVDEAHALGVMGPDGRGLCAEAAVLPDVLVGTFGKAFGAAGAFVAGPEDLTAWLWNKARPFVFSTGMSPVVAAAARASVELARSDAGIREAVAGAAALFRRGLIELGIRPAGHGHVIPWIVGGPNEALSLARALVDRGIHVQAIRPPSVPVGTARLRLTVTARHEPGDIERALTAIRDACSSR